ncbi:MAG: ATP-binding protein [Candidatus Nanohaloarchaea archaeon]
MMLKDNLRAAVKSQRENMGRKEELIEREIEAELDTESPHAVIISGVRRAGKSTLLKQLMDETNTYLNFEDTRLADFELRDFKKLQEIFEEEFKDHETVFLDEIQNVEEWEKYVRQQQEKGKKFFITGSNASMLSKELGTRLTGRHLTYEIFPFSYREMLELKDREASKESFKHYLEKGCFPEYLKYENQQILQELMQDILIRDIAVRHNIRDTETLRKMAVYLMTNIGNEITHNSLRDYFDLGSTNTVSSYISHFKESYLLFTIPQFHHSPKKQMVNPKKVYSIDTGLSKAHSLTSSPDRGRLLENAVFLHLRRQHNEIYYYQGENECDFLVREDGEIVKAFQSCYRLNERNKQREIDGIKEVKEEFNPEETKIVTLDQEEKIDGIEVVKAHSWMG